MSIQKVAIVPNGDGVLEYDVSGISFRPVGEIKETHSGKDVSNRAASESSGVALISKIGVMCNTSNIQFKFATPAGDGDEGSWVKIGESTEAALKVFAEKAGLPGGSGQDLLKMSEAQRGVAVDAFWKSQFRVDHLLEFTRDRKSMGVIVSPTSASNGVPGLLVKGAPESVLSRCTQIYMESVYSDKSAAVIPLKDTIMRQIQSTMDQYAEKGLRCLALAYKDFPRGTKIDKAVLRPKKGASLGDHYASIESELTFVGLVGMLDPPRLEVAASIKKCKSAGIRVIVITGDNKRTAEAVARRIGVFSENEDLTGKSLLGSEFVSLPEHKRAEIMDTVSLFSRVEPAHKQQLVSILQAKHEVVAMTGDGVNDAPALKKADIGIAMGTGTDVAKEASDMILQDDNFSTIVAAVEEGRAIYANTKQFIRYLISSNIGEVATIFFVAALGIPEALIPVQLLWVNLVTDGLPATALGFNKPDANIMLLPPRGRTDKIIDGWMFFRYFFIGLYIGFGTVLGFVWWFMWFPTGPKVSWEQLSNFHSCGKGISEATLAMFPEGYDCSVFHDPRPATIALSILVTIEMFNTFNALSENESLLSQPPWSNPWVGIAVASSMALHALILYQDFFVKIFHTAPLTVDEWMLVIYISFPVILFDECLKFFSRAMQSSKGRLKQD